MVSFEERIRRVARHAGATHVRKLGQGGMGEVHLIRQEENGELLALKVMVPDRAADATAQSMFLREGENCLALDHPNVVRAREVGFAEELFFLVMEFCDGGSLDHQVAQHGPLPVDEALPVIHDVLIGLQYAHTAKIPHVALAGGGSATSVGLVHRDLKPANIFVSAAAAGTSAKVGDFGLSKAFDLAGLSGLTRAGQAAGTPAFMPRQQVLDFLFAKPEVDVWAAAATLYFMLTEAVPRAFRKGEDPWRTVVDTAPVPIRERRADIPAPLAAVIDRALVDRPEIEFKKAAQLRTALEQAHD